MPLVVGLDIGSSAVRAVEVAQRGRSVKVRKAGRVPLPPGAVEGGQVREPFEVTKAVKRLWHETKFSTRSVRLGVGSGSVLVRPVELEWMPAPDLKKAMRYLVADLLPVPVDEANIDHVLLGEVERDGRRMARVLLVATARDGVDDVVRAVSAAGLRPTTADLAPLALVRFAARSQGPVATEAVVDIGVDKVSVAVHSHGLPRFVRVIPGLGGGTLTRALVEALGEDERDAEERKLQTPLGGVTVAGTVQLDQASLALRGAAVALAHEVRDTLQFHAAADPEHPAERVLLTGLGGANPGFAELVAQDVGLPTAPLSPPDVGRSKSSGPVTDADLAVSFGLCLGDAA
jgi:type IV pilus assembly protein PilM